MDEQKVAKVKASPRWRQRRNSRWASGAARVRGAAAAAHAAAPAARRAAAAAARPAAVGGAVTRAAVAATAAVAGARGAAGADHAEPLALLVWALVGLGLRRWKGRNQGRLMPYDGIIACMSLCFL